MEIVHTLATQILCILFSTTILWFTLKLFERKIGFFILLGLNACTTVIALIGLTVSQSFFLLLVIYVLSLTIFYWGLMKYSNIRTIFGCILIVIASSALETAIGKGLSLIFNSVL